MHLRTIVPTLGLATLAIGTTDAVEIGNVTLGGYVDAVGSVIDNVGFADTDPDVDFYGYTQLQVGAMIGDRASLQTDIEFMSDDATGDDIQLQQAYAAFGVTDTVTLQFGKWEGLIGYEAWDATGLYRVNTSPVFDMNGVLVEGLDINIAASEQLTVDLYIADGVFVADQLVTDSVGIGANATYATDTYTIDVDLGIDMDGEGTVADSGSIIGINVNGDYSAIENLVLFGDFAYRAYDTSEFNQMGLMLGGNYIINETVSGTLMVSYVEPNDEVDDNEITEVAVAALTNPTGDSNFGINYELAFQMTSDDNDEDSVGLFVEFLAVIP